LIKPDNCIQGIVYSRLIVLYFCMMVARFVSIAVFMKYLKGNGYGLNWREVFMMSFVHLKGAIGLSFTLFMVVDLSFP
jgi:NhaP-type Na+/H+ or K+/H+ antiporter